MLMGLAVALGALVASAIWAIVLRATREKPTGEAIDAEDIAVLMERDGEGNLKHKLCSFCAGWHIPPVTAAGCPRLKAGDIDKHQTVSHFEYWENWDKSNTIFPWQVDFPAGEDGE